MAEQLKSFFDRAVVGAIAKELGASLPKLDQRRFVAECMKGLEALELTPRARHIAEVMHRHLPQPFERAATALTQSLSSPLLQPELKGMAAFRYLPHVFYVAKYGLEDFTAAMQAQYLLTQHFTAEFSIRAFIERYPEKTHAQLTTWATDPSVHVRRLVSEGTRPRLPWAPRLRAYQNDPTPVVQLLELLKDDPERYVQRSVANNLNDIAKDHPDVCVAVCRRWKENASAARHWTIKHALRSLVKSGHPQALALLGVGAPPEVSLRRTQLPKQVRVGEILEFSFEVHSSSHETQALQVDYAVYFVKANGSSQPKVYKLKRLALAGKARERLKGRVSFRPMTTRKHYPGRHHVEARINGVSLPLGRFELIEG